MKYSIGYIAVLMLDSVLEMELVQSSAYSCDTICQDTYLMISASFNFKEMIDDCINDNSGYCQLDIPIGCWDTSQITDMAEAFKEQSDFNESINCWNVEGVTDMRQMFSDTESFNQPLNNWNVASVTNMAAMFNSSKQFNQPLNDWNVENVNDMSSMFHNATNFNQPLNNWNIESVTTTRRMFKYSKVSQGPIKRARIIEAQTEQLRPWPLIATTTTRAEHEHNAANSKSYPSQTTNSTLNRSFIVMHSIRNTTHFEILD